MNGNRRGRNKGFEKRDETPRHGRWYFIPFIFERVRQCLQLYVTESRSSACLSKNRYRICTAFSS